MLTTIKNIMDLSTFKNAKVIAGHKGMNKEVSSVTVAEVPDASDWLKGGEMVVTTGYFIKDNEDFQKKWINALIKNGASALAIKTDRFMGKIPEQMIEIANQNSFCLIELPLDITWPAILQSVFNLINHENSVAIKRTEEIHKKLTKTVFEGQGLYFIAKILAQLVDNIIIVEDAVLDNLAIASHNNNSEAVEEFLNYRLSTEYKKGFNSTEYYMSVFKNANRKPFALDFKDFNDVYTGLSQTTIPVATDGTVYGFISLVEFNKKANKIDMIALEHGATTVALEIMKEKVAIETEKRANRNFLDDLLEGRISTTATKVEKYKHIKFDVTNPAIAVFVEINKIDSEPIFDINKSSYRKSKKKVLDIIKRHIYINDPNAFINFENNKYTILYPFKINKDKNEVMSDIKKICTKITKSINEECPNVTYNFGIGNIYYNLENLKKSYMEAKKALEIGNTFIGFNQIHFYNDLGIYRLLFMIDHQEVVNFYNDTLEDLIEHDQYYSENLCKCLEMFLIHNGNISKASKKLYLHQNTLSYRLKKISNILGKDINDSRTRFNLYFAFLIKRILIDKE